MPKTVLVTGCSTGIGRATALYFREQGWNVVATVRSLEGERELQQLERMALVAMDVRDTASVTRAVDEAVRACGQVDAVINNAGYSLFGLFEEAPETSWRDQIETNLYGTIHVMRAMLPHFRARRSGVFVNVTSLVAVAGFPLNSYYTASKWGVEGITEALVHELKPYGIRFKLVQPGLTKTAAHAKYDAQKHEHIPDYDGFREAIVAKVRPDPDSAGSQKASEVAAEIYAATLDESPRLRYPLGAVTQAFTNLRREQPETAFLDLVSQQTAVDPSHVPKLR
ncbi:MAG: SDR family oxidoreductase [Steroidobacteraceae bacterium]